MLLSTSTTLKSALEPSLREFFSLGTLFSNRTLYEILTHLAAAAVTILVAIALLRLVPLLERVVIWRAKKPGRNKRDESAEALSQRIETLTRVTGSVARGLIWSVMVIVLLGVMGIPVAPLITGAGIMGVALGFGSQSIVKDFFAGFFILLEDQFGVGDTVTVAGVTGTVEQMTLRITVLRDASGTAHFIPNSNITIVANKTHGWVRVMLDASFSVQIPEEATRAVLAAAATKASAAPDHEETLIDPVSVEGPLDIAAGALTYRLVAKTYADRAAEVRRGMISALQGELATHGLRYDGPMIVERATTK